MEMEIYYLDPGIRSSMLTWHSLVVFALSHTSHTSLATGRDQVPREVAVLPKVLHNVVLHISTSVVLDGLPPEGTMVTDLLP